MADRIFDGKYSIEEIRGLIKSLCPGRRWISPNGESFRILEKEVRRDYPPYDSDPDRACFVVDSSEECGHAVIEIFRRPGGVRLQLRGGGEGFKEFEELLIREARGPGDAGAKKRHGPTVTTQERAKVFKRIKDKHPEYTQYRVAMDACKEMEVDNITKETVRYVYRAMGWTWEKSSRIR